MSDLVGFERMLDLSAQMLDAATANDWERLLALEKDEADLRESLRAKAGSDDAKISAEERDRLAGLISEIQANHAKLHEIVGPLLSSVRQLIGRETRERSIRESYGAFVQAP